MYNLLLDVTTSTVDWSRAQFALTAIYHWLFVPLTLGLAVVMGIVETPAIIAPVRLSGKMLRAFGNASLVSTLPWVWQRELYWNSSSVRTGATIRGW